MALIRSATPGDAAALLAVYRPYVEQSATSFELDVPGVDEFAARIRRSLDGWAWLVAEQNGACIGYAYATAYRSRPAYRFCAETSAYVSRNHQGRGVGRDLYGALLPALTAAGFCTAFAAITLPNDPSVSCHQSFGFEANGIFRRAGGVSGAQGRGYLV